MGRYSLWIDSFSHVVEYQEHEDLKDKKGKKNYYKASCLEFGVNGKKRTKFTLQEVDSLTAGYKDEKEFYDSLLRSSLNYHRYAKSMEKHHLVITYKHGGKYKKIEPVFDSKVLQLYAQAERKKKTKGSLGHCKEYSELLDNLLLIAEDKEDRNYIINPMKLEGNIKYKDKIKLNKYIPKTKAINKDDGKGSYAQIKIDKLCYYLENYSRIYDLLAKKQSLNETALEEEEELRYVRGIIDKAIRKDYKSLRNVVLFVKTYEQIKEDLKKEPIVKETKKKKEKSKSNEYTQYVLPGVEIKEVEDDGFNQEYLEEECKFFENGYAPKDDKNNNSPYKYFDPDYIPPDVDEFPNFNLDEEFFKEFFEFDQDQEKDYNLEEERAILRNNSEYYEEYIEKYALVDQDKKPVPDYIRGELNKILNQEQEVNTNNTPGKRGSK